jgi:hypothetical protein
MIGTTRIAMADLCFDHNIPKLAAVILRRAGHDVLEVRQVGMERAKDDALLLRAAQEGRIFVTHNEGDFTLLHDAWRRWSAAWGVTIPHAGVLIVPHGSFRGPAGIAERVEAILDAGAALANELYIFDTQGGWTRHTLPPP